MMINDTAHKAFKELAKAAQQAKEEFKEAIGKVGECPEKAQLLTMFQEIESGQTDLTKMEERIRKMINNAS
ncbi:MAG: hypothetical protein HRT61_00910 [Ekhidna sp.]|nr:hypothetical protein [Ekhidna sp.]